MQAARIFCRGGLMVKGDSGHSGRGRRTQAERSASTRAALVSAARDLFSTQGYAATGREEIVARAGVTRGALQHHFGDKETLFREVYELVEKELTDAVAVAAMAAGDDPLDELRAGCNAYLDAVLDPAVQQICAIDGPAVLRADVRQEITDRYALGLVREALQQAMAAGRIDEAPVEPLSQVLLAAVMAAAQYVATAAKPRKARADAGRTVELMLERLSRHGTPRRYQE
jgi:AcrR family transcriptional regulator